MKRGSDVTSTTSAAEAPQDSIEVLIEAAKAHDDRAFSRLVESHYSMVYGVVVSMVKDFAADVNQLQFRAGNAIDELVTGEAADVHQVMVAVEEAGIALDLMIEVRNRVLEGYQELIRMQV